MAGDAVGGFAALGMARAAVRELDGLAPEFSAVEAALGRGDGLDGAGALHAWQADWLATAQLRLRIDATREAAAWWLRHLPPDDADRAAELEAELGQLTAAVMSRWASLADRLADAGRRLAATRDPNPPPTARPRRTRASPSATTVPSVAPARAVGVALPIEAPDRVRINVGTGVLATPVPAPTQPRAHAAPAAAPRPPSRPPKPAEPTRGQPPVPVVAPAPPRGPAPIPRPSVVSPRAVPREQAPIPGPPAVAPRSASRAADTAGAARRPPGVAALLGAIALALVGALMLGTAAMLSSVPQDGASQPPEMSEDPSGAGVAPASAEPSGGGVAPTGTSGGPGSVLSVDAHPIGPLDPSKLPISFISGLPEVVAEPSAFDRSIRLAGESGFCVRLPGPTSGTVQSVTVEVHLADAGSRGTISFGLPATASKAPAGLQMDLAGLGALDLAPWYALTVRVDGQARDVALAPVDGGPAVFKAQLAGDSATPSGDETCLRAVLGSAESAILLDRLRAGP